MASERLDKLLLERGLVTSRTQAQVCISQGAVEMLQQGCWMPLHKPSQRVSRDSQLRVDPSALCPYVSRAGLKLASALEKLVALKILPGPTHLCAHGVHALDIGQSTGGFSDCLLQHGSASVLGIDVGQDQLASSLKRHPGLLCWEGINARYLPVERLLAERPGGFDWVVMDVSFISQTLILPMLPPILKPAGLLISLVKPQFEVGQLGLGKGGLVKDAAWYPKVHEKVAQCAQQTGFTELAWFESGITGTDGNREFFLIVRN